MEKMTNISLNMILKDIQLGLRQAGVSRRLQQTGDTGSNAYSNQLKMGIILKI